MNKDQEDRFLVSFSDILSLFRRSKKFIIYCGLSFGFLGLIFALLKPIRYQAEGTFREKVVRPNHVSSTSLMQMLSGGGLTIGESEAASLMTSRRILKHPIEKLHLQASLNELSDIESFPKLAKHNFMLAWSSVFGQPLRPVLQDPCCSLKIQTLHYTGELPLSFILHLQKDGNYEIFDLNHSQQFVGKGKLGEPFHFEKLTFIIDLSNAPLSLSSQKYILTVNSLQNTTQDLCKILKVEPSKLDKSLLKLKCEYRNRQLASEVVNATMESYQSYLKGHQQEIALNQLEYLNLRRDQLTQNLTNLMQRHADFLTHDLSNSGFSDSNKEMDFLARSQHEYKQKLLDNELEIKRLTNIKPSNLAYYDRYSSNDGDPAVINSMLSEMRALKQQRDALEIELQKKSRNQGDNLKNSFEQQLKELEGVQQYLIELRQIEEGFKAGNLADIHSKLMNDPRFLLQGWLERLQNAGVEQAGALREVKENFQFYLNNLERSFGVHERILQERLTHQQNPSGEYQGISLEVATNLYLDYSKQLIQMEETIRQNLFFIHQIEDPNFEITSLSAGLDDAVSNDMIRKASELVLNLRDQNNQSLREQERIKEELALQRTFLTMHLKQMVQLMELNKQLIDEKIFALENVSLELIHQRISLLEKNLQDYLKSRLFNLQQERILIERHLESLHGEMALLPQKWVAEQLLTQEVETNQKIVEEIAKLVESKNISHNLEIIQSAPIDSALPPVHPLPSKVFLWSILGFLLGSCLGGCFILGKSFKNGLTIVPDKLELMGLYIAGYFNIFSPSENIETLRKLQAFFDSHLPNPMKKGEVLLLIKGKGPDYTSQLADLYLKRGKKVLRLDFDFYDANKITIPGLLQYLNGEIAYLPIRHGKHGDWIAAGGSTRFVIELINLPIFEEALDRLKQEYDYILISSPVLPLSRETESLLGFFPKAAMTLDEEKMDDLIFYKKLQEQHSKYKLIFILSENSKRD